jgi:fructose-bisphosphate aldolase class II
MPLVTDTTQCLELYDEAREKGVALACFDAENRRTVEAYLKAAHRLGQEAGVDDVPIVLGFTTNYPDRGQMHWYVDVDDVVLGAKALVQDLQLLLSDASPYKNVRVMLHLDHGQPGPDDVFFYEEFWIETFASMMYDASHWSFDENIEMTAKYVEKVKGRTLVEGAVDEIVASGSEEAEHNVVTEVADAEKFVLGTGADLIVPNVGTEHRASSSELNYRDDRAREIANAVGNILCLHGTSCLRKDQLPKLKDDGIVKVNVWTGMERDGAEAVARFVIEQLGNVVSEATLKSLVADGYLGTKYAEEAYLQGVCDGKIAPKLDFFPEIERKRRWIDAVTDHIANALVSFGYRNLGN